MKGKVEEDEVKEVMKWEVGEYRSCRAL